LAAGSCMCWYGITAVSARPAAAAVLGRSFTESRQISERLRGLSLLLARYVTRPAIITCPPWPWRGAVAPWRRGRGGGAAEHVAGLAVDTRHTPQSDTDATYSLSFRRPAIQRRECVSVSLCVCLPLAHLRYSISNSHDSLLSYVAFNFAKHCDDSVCLSVRSRNLKTAPPVFTQFPCTLLMAVVWLPIWWSCDMLHIRILPVLWMT